MATFVSAKNCFTTAASCDGRDGKVPASLRPPSAPFHKWSL